MTPTRALSRIPVLPMAVLCLACSSPGEKVHPCDACLPCEVCVSEGDDILCEPTSHFETECGADGFPHWVDSCGLDEGVVEECPSNAHCEQSGGEAFCVCEGLFVGELCDECEGNRDPLDDCESCENNWVDDGDDCGTCPANWDPASDCAECLGNWDIATGCESCENNWEDDGDDCGTCPGNWDPASDCAVCLGNWDIATGCESCENNWVDDGDDCGTCPGNWDEATDCVECATNWIDEGNDCGTCPSYWDSGLNCAVCLGNYDPSTDCTACYPGWQGTLCAQQPECVRYVDVNTTAASPNGYAWSLAFDNVQDGIDAAAAAVAAAGGPSECAVWVAQGTYYIYETSRYDTVQLAQSVLLYGGFDGTETALAQRDVESNPTVLDGRDSSASLSKVYHVVTGANLTLISGFTITRGQADGTLSTGGGLLANGCSPNVELCTFESNTAQYGGGVGAIDSDMVMDNCAFEANTASWGGGLYADGGGVDIYDSRFSSNTASEKGGGLYSLDGETVVYGTDFSQNTADDDGGGASFMGGAPALSRCTFVDNYSDDDGGGMAMEDSSSEDIDAVVQRSLFLDNEADSDGGGLFLAGVESNVARCVFARNSAVSGAGLSVFFQDMAIVTKSVFYGNTASSGGGGIYHGVFDIGFYLGNVLWANSPDQNDGSVGDHYWAYNDVQGGVSGTGNIASDPLFTDPYNDDYSLAAGSPCIDAGYGAGTYYSGTGWMYTTPSLILDLNLALPKDDPSVADTGAGTPTYVDIGAFERTP